MIAQHTVRKGLSIALLCGVVAATSACTHQPPTIAHTHIGHAVTGFDGTPEEKGLFEVAELRAQEALVHAEAASSEGENLDRIKHEVQLVIDKSRGSDYGLKDALEHAVRHIDFAATSEDASANVKRGAAEIETAANDVLNRCDLVILLGNDVLATRSIDEGRLLSRQIKKLAQINVDGDPAAGEVGMVQLRERLDEMIESEDPPYETVDRWYLFHLVRLPDCDTCWAWRKWADSSNRGY